ncbi:MAG: hypothetical protein H0Z24_10215 [Thermosipho sp. (in: Bacteria)]|nr:hypothetical protein [Thermosipho sp. (in: thermotogales)]
MRVTVSGICMDIEEKVKDGQTLRTALLYQPGERELVPVRLSKSNPTQGEHCKFDGDLLFWRSKNGIGFMVVEKDG